MMTKLSHSINKFRTVMAVLLAVLAVQAGSGRQLLITNPSQLSSNASAVPELEPASRLENLIDGNADTFWHSDYTNDNHTSVIKEYHWLQVDFGENTPLELQSDEDIVIYTQRRNITTAQPTTFRIEGSNDGESWTSVAHAYFVYRGPKTKEYSARIHPATSYRYLRFILRANNSRSTSGCQAANGTDVRFMNMAEFNIIKLGRNENYSDILVDRFRLTTDYHDFGDMNFEHSRGIADKRNRYADGQVKLNLDGLFDDNGAWTKDKAFWDKAAADGLKLNKPDMTYLTSDDDKDIKQGSGVRQKANVMEHVLYAVPGDAIALYPYYDFRTTSNYQDKFVHWYDYYTGGSNPYLDFLVNPENVIRTDNNGYFGGATFSGYTVSPDRFAQQHPDWVRISNIAEWNAFAERVNNGENYLNAYLAGNISASTRQTLKSVGTETYPYRGHFTGLERAFGGVTFGSTDEQVGGIFAWVGAGAVIEDFWCYSTVEVHGNAAAGLIGAIPAKETGSITLRRIVGDHSVKVAWRNAGGIFGCNYSSATLNIEYCGFFGRITGGIECGAIAGWVGSNPNTCIVSSYDGTTAEQFGIGIENNNIFMRGTASMNNCYSRRGGNGLRGFSNNTELASMLGYPWFEGDDTLWHNVYCFATRSNTRDNSLIATFMVPRDVYADEGNLKSLVFPDGRDEIVIACDVAQEFDASRYYDAATNTLLEPTVSVRHIFRIRDGKKFADDNMSTYQNNRRYINQNVRYVNAPAGRNFQVRFDSPIPVQGTTRSKWYYKARSDESDYRRICSMDVEVYDEKGNKLDSSIFRAESGFLGYGSRTIEGIAYNACGGGGSYNRMLACDADKAIAGKTYIVRLIAKDINGRRIIIPDGSGEELWVQEFRITFLGTENASVVSESELMSNPAYESRRPANLQYLGELRDVIDYDDYALLESTANVETPGNYLSSIERSRRYKFRQDRLDIGYTFGYHATGAYDYSNYNVVSHSDGTGYSAATGSDGLYDRKYYDTNGREHGYYFFINACTDPGVMGRLKMGGFCLGSTVHVSGWYYEGSGGEVANLAFNFVAVLNDGQRVPLHSFVSGYVPENGKWHNIYYSFIPEVTHLAKEIYNAIDHYELELDNNCRNSGGADYGIDDIRVYITTPDVHATQTSLICDDDINGDPKASLKVSSPFNMLLQSLGIHEAQTPGEAEELDIYYTFIDKEKFDVSLATYHDKARAFNESVLKFPYREPDNSTQEKLFGQLKFFNNFSRHPEYAEEEGDKTLSEVAFRELIGTEEWISFNTRPRGSRLRPGKEFYVVLYTPLIGDEIPTDENAVTVFDPQRDCAKVSTFRVRTAGQIKIDGNVIPPGAPIEVCEGQSPVVQLDVATKPLAEGDLDNNTPPVIENAYFDWYTGSMDQFMAEGYDDEHGNRITLRQMLGMLRQEYRGIENLDLCEPKGELTEQALEYLKGLARISEDGKDAPSLKLHSSSFVFPPVEIPDGQDMGYAHVIAVPFDYMDDMWLICTAPTEVTIAVKHHSPTMSHGFAEGIEYPEGIEDVPLRIGLKQLNDVSAAEGWTTVPESRLSIPVRKVVPATKYVNEMSSGADPLIYLVATNDPEYQDLGISSMGLMPVGEVVALTAKKDGGSRNAVEMMFYNTFKFKEGYRYTLRYNFEELASAEKPDDVEDNGVVCKGQDSFTLLVVPEYLEWHGVNGSTNWADDMNWRRMPAKSLNYKGPTENHDLTDHITDGSNSRLDAFVPMDFTKVVVRKGTDAPALLNAGDTQVSIGGENFTWSSNPYPTESGVTGEIQFHMAARSRDNKSVDCRPWLDNECDEIHFGNAAEIGAQQLLRYNRAHVETELDPSRWYTLSSPLADIVAGDMYLPTASARQETELFLPIKFDRKYYDRFAPAVFQRSWNRAYAWVHEVPGGSETDPKTDVFVETTWSGVYNEVNEKYTAGTGFSIKIDGSTVGMGAGKKALLRLPKDDLKYSYHTDDDMITGSEIDVRKTEAGRLNPVDGEIFLENYHAGNKYFLVGNPFMSHMDMAVFLDINSDKIQRKYWILTADAQLAGVMDPVSGALISNTDDPGFVPPMQGFFVEALEPIAEGATLKLRYTSKMAVVRNDQASPMKMPGSRLSDTPKLSISAIENGKAVSSAVIAISSLASADYDSAEDVPVIFDNTLGHTAIVYTVAGDRAAAVNLTPGAAGVEVGLRTIDGEGRRTLRFEGVEAVDGLSLYDKADGSLTALDEGIEVTVDGDARGRFFLMSSLPGMETTGLTIRLEGRTVTVISADASSAVEACVYDSLGCSEGCYSTDDAVLTFDLDSGIHIVEACDKSGRVTRKFIVK